jgi:hypothetical protein
MALMKRFVIFLGLGLLMFASAAVAQKDNEDADQEPTSWIYFSVVKDDNGKPVRNAAVILHAVDQKGKQERGDMELKTDPDGKADFDGIPYGKLRVQVLAQGFQTYGQDFDVTKSKTEISIKLKRPQTQYSIYDDRPNSGTPPSAPPPDAKKPN